MAASPSSPHSAFSESRSHTLESHYSSTTSQYQSTLGSAGLYSETLQDRLEQTKRWLYNADESLVMGRTLLDWGFLIVSYLMLFGAVIGMSAAFCGIFYWKIHWNYPTHYGAAGLLQTPGLAFRPQPDVSTSVIRFLKNDGSSYAHYLDHIEAYVQYYENKLQQGDSFTECRDITARRRTNLKKACPFDISDHSGPCIKQVNYGFDDGQPCVLLKLNRVYNWQPEEYTNDTVPDAIKDMWDDPWWIYVKCDGDDAFTRENMGSLAYYPPRGFHFKYFPFKNQQSYRSPLLFVQFEAPHVGVLLRVTCRAYAKNIQQDEIEMSGAVRFELMVD